MDENRADRPRLDPRQVRLGIAPIGWTNDDMPDLGGWIPYEQCLSEMALAGFEGCEIGGKFPEDTAVLAAALSLRGLSVCNAWFSSFLTSRPLGETLQAFEKHVARLAALGAAVVGVSEQGNSIQGRPDRPILEGNPAYTEDEWHRVLDGFGIMGRLARDQGLSLLVHHHMGTGIQSSSEIDRLMDGTDPDRVGLLFDTGHLAFAGEDPLAVLRRHGSRIRHVHLKDIRRSVLESVRARHMSFLDGVRAGVFTVPGDGDLDFRPIVDALAAQGYRGWMVVEAEQDPSRANPLEYALKARRYLRQVSGL